MSKKKKTPIRTCVGCQEKQTKRELFRIVRTPEGEIKLDPTGKANGRGAYVCPEKECLEKALKKDKLKKALNTNVSEESKQKIMTEWHEYNES